MKIHRSRPESGFTQIPNGTLRDPGLSYRARGVLAEILSNTDDWPASADTMSQRARQARGKEGEGRGRLRAAFAELEGAGDLHRHISRGTGGRFATELHVSDLAQELQPDGHPLYCALAEQLAGDVSAGGTDDQTGSRRSDLAKLASSQVAPTTSPPAVGPPVVGPPAVGPPVVYKNTKDEHQSKNTNNEDHRGPEDIRDLQSPVPVEGNGAAPVQDHHRWSDPRAEAARQAAEARAARLAREANGASPARHCAACGGPMRDGMRAEAIYCTRRCKENVRKGRARKTSTEGAA